MTANEKENALNAQYEKINNCRDYLTKTDYIIIRSLESGVEVPVDVKSKRSECRASINEAEAEIELLERTEVEEFAS